MVVHTTGVSQGWVHACDARASVQALHPLPPWQGWYYDSQDPWGAKSRGACHLGCLFRADVKLALPGEDGGHGEFPNFVATASFSVFKFPAANQATTMNTFSQPDIGAKLESFAKLSRVALAEADANSIRHTAAFMARDWARVATRSGLAQQDGTSRSGGGLNPP